MMKNNMSDLIEFFFFTALIIVGFFALARYGYLLFEKKYAHLIDAKLSGYEDYIRSQWEAAKVEPKKIHKPPFLESNFKIK